LLTRELQKEGHFVVILDLNFPEFENIQIDNKMVERINVKNIKLKEYIN